MWWWEEQSQHGVWEKDRLPAKESAFVACLISAGPLKAAPRGKTMEGSLGAKKGDDRSAGMPQYSVLRNYEARSISKHAFKGTI